ncbi:hypothetical protein CWO85_00960 [Candidatus Phytoplasma ziziphi]|uniref:Uncharacterized protein n=1 Tax=Ziziphus jujuba witches'-broom phytoplasma TaxID=135727 RepID=A0A660HM43_ZIZJU|nr:hypothetical protein [Candidatus Phytoplasma ziziphi]AYJ01107.1 hypothetical protein CWO85_00960 [Candidatus Phytoplasma ziziphi]
MDFDLGSQKRLAEALRRAHARGVKWLTTNYPTQEILQFYQGFNFNYMLATTNVKKKKKY